MKSKRFIYKKIKIPLYRNYINLFEYNKYNCDKIHAEYNEAAMGYTNVLISDGVCIGITKKTTIPEIAHECLHATNKILNRAGYKVDINNDESQTYLFTYIMEQVLKHKDKIFKKRK